MIKFRTEIIRKSRFLMFLIVRLLQFDSANTVLNRGNAIPNTVGGPFIDIGDISVMFIIAKSKRT
jgi:hypothetical protein